MTLCHPICRERKNTGEYKKDMVKMEGPIPVCSKIYSNYKIRKEENMIKSFDDTSFKNVTSKEGNFTAVFNEDFEKMSETDNQLEEAMKQFR